MTTARERMLDGLGVTERRLRLGGASTAVLEAGRGAPLVLLHGGIECGGAVWAPVIPLLARRHRVVVPDLPGLGASEPVRRLDGPTFASWFRALLEHTCSEEPVLVAHSLGGTLAARFATAEGRRLRRLVIYACPGIGPYRMPLGLRVVAIRFSIRPSERNAERFERWAFADYDSARARTPDWFAAFSEYCRVQAREPHVKTAMRQLIRSCTKQVPDSELIRIPALVGLVTGSEDRFVARDLTAATGSRLGWPMETIQRAGHAAHIERPVEFVQALKALDDPTRAQARGRRGAPPRTPPAAPPIPPASPSPSEAPALEPAAPRTGRIRR